MIIITTQWKILNVFISFGHHQGVITKDKKLKACTLIEMTEPIQDIKWR
jgi:hypothetical protein